MRDVARGTVASSEPPPPQSRPNSQQQEHSHLRCSDQHLDMRGGDAPLSVLLHRLAPVDPTMNSRGPYSNYKEACREHQTDISQLR